MTTRSQTSIEGALYELVARGSKDLFFTKDDKSATHPFQWTYERWPASLPEIRSTQPLNQVRWGQRCEFEFDLPGDVLTEATLLIDLPTWLPPPISRNNSKAVTYETGTTDTVYGYVRGIAYFMFERIEIYQDGVLLQEVTGDSLYFASLNKGSLNQGFLTQRLAGDHDGSDLSIQRNATPGRLELPVPMIGCSFPGDRGLPSCCLRQQTFRLRLTLRPLDQLVECSDSTVRNPSPWKTRFSQLDPVSATVITQPAIPLDRIGQPLITLRTKQLYLLNEARQQLESETVEIPYVRYFDNLFGANQLDYAPINKGGTAYLVKYLDATFSVERIFTYFRNSADIQTNRLWSITNSQNAKGDYYSNLQLTIAGQLREGPWAPNVWELVIPHAKEERYSVEHLPLMNWTRGWRIEDAPPAIREPTGGINFSTADRPMFTTTLTDISINPTLRYKQMQMNSCCESWALYKIKKGKGQLQYYN